MLFSDGELFLDAQVNALLRTLLRHYARSPSAVAQLSLDALLPARVAGAPSWAELFGALVEQFEGAGYADPTFASCVLLPLAQSNVLLLRQHNKYNPHIQRYYEYSYCIIRVLYCRVSNMLELFAPRRVQHRVDCRRRSLCRKVFWLDHPDAARLVRLSPAELVARIPCALDVLLEPPECDLALLRAYFARLCTPPPNRSRPPAVQAAAGALYLLLVHHVSSFLYEHLESAPPAARAAERDEKRAFQRDALRFLLDSPQHRPPDVPIFSV